MNKNFHKLGLGGATFGNILADGIFGGVNQEKSIEIIDYAYESVQKYLIPNGFENFRKIINQVYEN